MLPQSSGPHKVLTNQSMAATFKTAGFRVPQRSVAFQVRTTNSDGAGTWRMQGTNIDDGTPKKGPSTTDADWDTLTLGITNPPDSASANESFLFQCSDFAYAFVRLLWTRTAGTSASTCSAWLEVKGL